ncbi:aconitate hydratase AcnA [Paraburkholderia oxyphila]|uniref:aconitate hydratase AcnA n=1 Tax=Paraburkholderia oxyphila TaxID=614212 RepID=UPI000A0652B4|nr:aconitate hydratase AcnA [Paraburkholderia oxyphila]
MNQIESTMDLAAFVQPIDWGDGGRSRIISLRAIEVAFSAVERFPASIRILLEAMVRRFDGEHTTSEHLNNLLAWHTGMRDEIPAWFSRVLLQDASGIPLLSDLAAMRAAALRDGVAAESVQPRIPVDLVIDHSVVVDFSGTPSSREQNLAREFQNNDERYQFVKWAEQAFNGLRVVPPGHGIVHQVNLEYLSTGLVQRDGFAFPDTLVGTDSHTTMANGLGILGWGVGGLEAELAVLGLPLYIPTPEVIAVALSGSPQTGTNATDVALYLTGVLREYGVVGKLLEFVGAGARALSVPDRATIANMAPEYGATTGYFATDEKTLAYFRDTGRSKQLVDRLRTYCLEQRLFGIPDAVDLNYSATLEVDLSRVGRRVSGPRRPHQTLSLPEVRGSLPANVGSAQPRPAHIGSLSEGAVVLAAITSCTNTANPAAMLTAGLVAKAAVERGMTVPGYVKTVLAPGSLAVTKYLQRADVLSSLEALGFHVAAYGCAVCVGNSGSLQEGVEADIAADNLTVAAVLSGNRNFEGRIHPHINANYLASPALVIAYALAGTVLVDLENEPVATDRDGNLVFLRDLWPDEAAVQSLLGHACIQSDYGAIANMSGAASQIWNGIKPSGGAGYQWQEDSTYFVEPPFFDNMRKAIGTTSITGARVLAVLGDSITTDHISPVGRIAVDSDAGQYLQQQGVRPEDFNTYGARRCNHHLMVRGTFASPRLANALVRPVVGPFTRSARDGRIRTLFEVARENTEDAVPSVIVAGKSYGAGSARDWAARGTALLGVSAVLARSFERIHRSNLVLMGVLPIEIPDSADFGEMEWCGAESIDIHFDCDELACRQPVRVVVTRAGTEVVQLTATLRVDTPAELRYLRGGGVFSYVYVNSCNGQAA